MTKPNPHALLFVQYGMMGSAEPGDKSPVTDLSDMGEGMEPQMAFATSPQLLQICALP